MAGGGVLEGRGRIVGGEGGCGRGRGDVGREGEVWEEEDVGEEEEEEAKR